MVSDSTVFSDTNMIGSIGRANLVPNIQKWMRWDTCRHLLQYKRIRTDWLKCIQSIIAISGSTRPLNKRQLPS